MTTVYRNVRFLLPNRKEQGDVFLTDDRLTTQLPTGVPDREIDGGELFLLPGLVDVHTHLREPGFSYKETIASGTRAAAAGGYTVVCSMPNLNPTPDCPAHLDIQLAEIERQACVKVYPFGSITVGEKGQALAEIEAMAPDVAGYSDDGVGVVDDGMMREAFLRAKAVDRPIVAHCEYKSLVNGGVIHAGAYAKAHGLPGISSESEWKMVERDLRLVEETGCQYHICHISTAETVALLRQAKAAGLPVTGETGPHYLTLCDADLQDEGRFKMNPPLRAASDRDALIQAVCDGTIDCIATDHAPHSAEEKSKGLLGSLMGIVGLETALPVLYTHLVKPGVLTMETLVERMSTAPRRIFRMPDEQGVTLFDPTACYTVDPDRFQTMGRATPYAGMPVCGRVLATAIDNTLCWKSIE